MIYFKNKNNEKRLVLFTATDYITLEAEGSVDLTQLPEHKKKALESLLFRSGLYTITQQEVIKEQPILNVALHRDDVVTSINDNINDGDEQVNFVAETIQEQQPEVEEEKEPKRGRKKAQTQEAIIE